MANYRKVHTKFWTDHKVEPLTKESKLLALYLMTNPHRSSSGLYPITKSRIARDCSIKVEEVDTALEELAEEVMVAEAVGRMILEWLNSNPHGASQRAMNPHGG